IYINRQGTVENWCNCYSRRVKSAYHPDDRAQGVTLEMSAEAPSSDKAFAGSEADVEMMCLPSDVRERLAQLELELSEGDITQKGYDKKRQQLLAPFINTEVNGTFVFLGN
uniref:DMAP1-binding domain-containing protein n=1 Tax=Parascaris univalens TaxID=6257 RepID=A0A915CJN9_PARUN